MALLKISLLIFAAVFHVLPSTAHQFPKRWTARRFNDLQDGSENCFCYPDGQIQTVQHLLDSNNKGQERLVIYLYKNVDTNEIKMYVPQAEKQALIPDIPYDAGDGLTTISTEYVYSLLYQNPNKIKVYNDYIETVVPTVSDSLPIGLHTGEIEHIIPTVENYLNPNDNYNDNGFPSPRDIVVTNDESSNTFAGDTTDFENLDQDGTMYNYPFTITSKPENTPLDPQVFSDSTPPTPHTVVAVPLNPGSSPYNFPSTATTSQFSETSQDLTELDLNNNHANLNDVYTFETEQDSSHHFSFDTWFYQQLQRFKNNRYPTDIKVAESDILKEFVLQIFSKYNMSISTDGYIKNAKGEAMDPLNLELRHVFLGEKYYFQILGNSHTVIKLSNDRQFLEGILVTLVSPPQILGIIPLAKNNLSPKVEVAHLNSYLNANPASSVPYLTVKDNVGSITSHSFSEAFGVPTAGNSYYETHIKALPLVGYQIPQRSVNEVTYWSSGPYHTVLNMPYPRANLDHSDLTPPFDHRRKQSDTKIQHFYEPPKDRKKLKGFSSLAREEEGVTEEFTTTEPFLNVNASESGISIPPSSLSGVMKTFLDHLIQRRKHLNSTNDVNILNDSEDNDGEAPDFRIIGGNAATGSGTPLSNKGRSGFTENA